MHIGSVAFIENSAANLGGAIYVAAVDLLQVNEATFTSNQAPLGGAVYIAGFDSAESEFISCVFEGNQASDGGAVYLYTGSGVDSFTASIFRNNFASESPRYSRTPHTRHV